MIKAIIFHPKVIQSLSDEKLNELKKFFLYKSLKVFLVAEKEDGYKDVVKEIREIMLDFVTKRKVEDSYKCLAKRGSKLYVQWIKDKYCIEPHEILYVGCGHLDWRTSINGGTFYIQADFVRRVNIPVFRAKSFSNLLGIINLFLQMKDGLFSYRFLLDDGVERRFLFDVGVKIPVDGGKTVSLWEIIKSDYEQGHTIGGRPARESLLLLLLLQLWLSGALGQVNYFVFYPGHKSGAGNRLLEDYFAEIAKSAFKSYFKDGLIFRIKDTLQKHKARLRGEYSSINFEKEFNTLCIKKRIPKQRRIVVIDDFSTTGLSLEAAKSLLMLAGYKGENIKLVAIGKYGGAHDLFVLKEQDIDPFDCGNTNKINERSYSKETVKVSEFRDSENEKILLTILKNWAR